MSIRTHEPPGRVTDLTSDNIDKWSHFVSELMRDEKVSPEVAPQFYDATQVLEGDDVESGRISWLAFPKMMEVRHPISGKRWEAADDMRENQNEYLEWSVKRNKNQEITKVVFTSEFPEYFDFLGREQPDTLLKLYQGLHPGENIERRHLFKEDNPGRLVYNRFNPWNDTVDRGTIMHLNAPGGKMRALTRMVTRATVSYKYSDGTMVTNSNEITARISGDWRGNADPVIAAYVNGLARNGDMITLDDPIGIYIDAINLAQIELPENFPQEDLAEFFKFTRGAPGWHTRLECEVPEGRGFILADLKVAGQPINYGAQLADLIMVSARVRMFSGERMPPRTAWQLTPGGTDD